MQHPLRFFRLARDHAGLAGRVLVIGLLAIFQEQVIAAVRAAFNSITGSP